MAIQVGDRIPDVELHTMGDRGPETVRTAEALGTGKVILFAVPGAFTPGCSRLHLPGYVQHADELKAKGIDIIACTAVNDAWVMEAWAKDQGVGDKILMLADGSGVLAEAMGLVLDGTASGIGKRSKRYAAMIEDGVIKQLDVDESGAVDVSACSAVIAQL